jgi:hypothetical protein
MHREGIGYGFHKTVTNDWSLLHPDFACAVRACVLFSRPQLSAYGASVRNHYTYNTNLQFWTAYNKNVSIFLISASTSDSICLPVGQPQFWTAYNKDVSVFA